MRIIDRPIYMNKLMDVKNTPDIKVITGIRRSGKSRLIEQYAEILKQEDHANVVHFKNPSENSPLLVWEMNRAYLILCAIGNNGSI